MFEKKDFEENLTKFQSELKELETQIQDITSSRKDIAAELKGSDTPIVRDLVTQINALNVTNVNNCIENFYIYLCGDPSTTTQAISDLETHAHLLSNLHISINELIEARNVLEGIGLLKTYLNIRFIDREMF